MAHNPRQIDFIVIGAQKSGSSFLQLAIADHPDIEMPIGETPYFQDPDYHETNLQEVLDGFRSSGATCFGIKRPDYFAAPEVPPRIMQDCPTAKLIVMLRHPIDRCLSSWYHNIHEGFLPPIDAETGLTKLLDQGASAFPTHPRAMEVLQYGLYAKHLENYQSLLDQDRLQILLHHDLLRHPQLVLDQCFQFLGVQPHKVCGTVLMRRPQSVIYSLTRLRWLKHRSRLLYHFNKTNTRTIRRTSNPIRMLLAGGLILSDRMVLKRWFGNDKPSISAILRERLIQYYRADIQTLIATHGLSVSQWFDDTSTESSLPKLDNTETIVSNG